MNLSTIFKHTCQYLLISGLFSSINAIATEVTPEKVVIHDSGETECTVLSPDLEYNYSQLHARLFKHNAPTPLPSMSKIWQVFCSTPVTALFLTVDSVQQANPLSASDPTRFWLNPVNDRGRLGYYQITLDNAMVDGSSVQLYQTSDPTQMSKPQSSILLKSASFQGWTFDGHIPAKGQQYSVRVTISPTLNSLQETQGPLVNGEELNSELVLAFPFNL